MRGSKLARRLSVAVVVAVVLAGVPQAALAGPARPARMSGSPAALEAWVGGVWAKVKGWLGLASEGTGWAESAPPERAASGRLPTDRAPGRTRGVPWTPLTTKEGPGYDPGAGPCAAGPCGDGGCTDAGPEVGPDG